MFNVDSYIRNCFVKLKKGTTDCVQSHTVKLDGYAIVPLDEYLELSAKNLIADDRTTLNECIKVVEDLNSSFMDLFDEKTYQNFYYPFSVNAYGICGDCQIMFLGDVIWDSDNDDREFNEEKDEYEDLQQHILTKTHAFLEFLVKGLRF